MARPHQGWHIVCLEKKIEIFALDKVTCADFRPFVAQEVKSEGSKNMKVTGHTTPRQYFRIVPPDRILYVHRTFYEHKTCS